MAKACELCSKCENVICVDMPCEAWFIEEERKDRAFADFLLSNCTTDEERSIVIMSN